MASYEVVHHSNADLAGYPTYFPIVTSTFDNCVLLNALLKNSDPYDDDDVRYLRQLQGADKVNVEDYYRRSEHIITAMREQGADNDGVWDHVDRTYIDAIIEKIKVRDFSTLFSDILHMIEQLELQYGVVNDGN